MGSNANVSTYKGSAMQHPNFNNGRSSMMRGRSQVSQTGNMSRTMFGGRSSKPPQFYEDNLNL